MWNFFIKLMFLFYMGSFLGWVIELLFRKFISTANPERKWLNPGFLVGPCLPLYGFGLIGFYLISIIPINISEIVLKDIVLVLIMGIVMTIIEYVTGIFFLKSMHIRLWDYTGRWANIQGVICPLFSFLWCIVGTGYLLLLHPKVEEIVNWVISHPEFYLVIGAYYGVLIVDVVYSFKLVARIKLLAQEYDIVVRYEALKASVRSHAEEQKKKWNFILALRSDFSLREMLEQYIKH